MSSSSLDLLINKIGYEVQSLCSGVARAPCALGQEIFLHPSSTKTTEFEMKNKCESCGRSKIGTFM